MLATLNRPSIGFSACAAKPGDAIAELGYGNAASEQGRLSTWPQGFLRFGAARDLEFDVIGPAYGAQNFSGVQSHGFFDSGIGAKYELWHDDARALAVDFLYTIPTGAAAFSAGAPTETFNVDYTTPLSKLFSFATTLGTQSSYAASLRGGSSRFFTVVPSAVLTDQWNSRAQAFVEAFGQTRIRPDGGSLFGMDAAVQYLLTPQTEIDVEVQRTVSDVERSHAFGFGFGVRF